MHAKYEVPIQKLWPRLKFIFLPQTDRHAHNREHKNYMPQIPIKWYKNLAEVRLEAASWYFYLPWIEPFLPFTSNISMSPTVYAKFSCPFPVLSSLEYDAVSLLTSLSSRPTASINKRNCATGRHSKCFCTVTCDIGLNASLEVKPLSSNMTIVSELNCDSKHHFTKLSFIFMHFSKLNLRLWQKENASKSEKIWSFMNVLENEKELIYCKF